MLWVRGLIFTAIVPVVIAYFLPRWLGYHATAWPAGWLLIVPGVLIYAVCLMRFLAAGGTPANTDESARTSCLRMVGRPIA